MHFVLTPSSIVHASILIIKFALAMPHILELIAFISTSLFEGFNHIFCLSSSIIIFVFVRWVIFIAHQIFLYFGHFMKIIFTAFAFLFWDQVVMNFFSFIGY